MNGLFPQRRLGLLALLCALCLVSAGARADDSLPGVQIQNVRRVFDNGEHGRVSGGSRQGVNSVSGSFSLTF